MGKKQKQKILLPPDLPPEIPDDEVEVSDDDHQFVKDNRAFASLLSTLDTKAITKSVNFPPTLFTTIVSFFCNINCIASVFLFQFIVNYCKLRAEYPVSESFRNFVSRFRNREKQVFTEFVTGKVLEF